MRVAKCCFKILFIDFAGAQLIFYYNKNTLQETRNMTKSKETYERKRPTIGGSLVYI